MLSSLPTQTAVATQHELLTELVAVDLEYRWRQPANREGDDFPDRPRLEDYQQRFPVLGPIEELPADLVAHEYRVRQQWGNAPGHEEFVTRFGASRSELVEQLKAVDRDLEVEEALRSTMSQSDKTATVVHDCQRASGSVDDSDASLPETFGRYRIVRLLGRGAMGAVYLANDTQLGRKVALKIPRFHETCSLELKERFFREARTAARKPAVEPTVAGVDHERRVAKWVLSIGGSVTLDKRRVVRPGDRLPSDKFIVKSITVANGALTDDNIAEIRDVIGLTNLFIGQAGRNLTADGLAHLRQLPPLDVVSLASCHLDDDAVKALVKLNVPLTQLKSVTIDDTSLRHFGEHPTLRSLRLSPISITAKD